MNTTFKQIDNDVFLGSPFVYKIRPEYYPGIVNAALNNPQIFEDLSRFKENISSIVETGNIPDELESYYNLIRKDVKSERSNFSADDIKKTLNSIEEYKLFFKEMGSSLKFNPLSRNKSAIQIRERANWLIHKYGNLIEPKAIARYINVKIGNGSIFIENTDIEFKSKKLSSFFHDADKEADAAKQMVIYVVTIGSGIDDTVKLLGKEGEMFDSYILNGIGAAAAEMVAEDLNYYLNDILKNGNSGMKYYRFSPGYGDWLVNDQEKLFKLLKPEERIGVILNEGNIMLPEKSTSGIMGLKPGTFKQIFHSGNE